MLDFRHETFLELCRIGNFTKTAEILHITQPAVSQHIRVLEEKYSCKLFYYEGKSLKITPQGQILWDFALTMSADSKKLKSMLGQENDRKSSVSFGATLTIGEYIMPTVLQKLAQKEPDLHLTMLVDNTEALLHKLRDGKIDFALLEGFFDKERYGGAPFARQRLIGLCSAKSELRGRKITFDNLLSKRLILREKGSGTRDIFEQSLTQHNLTVQSFQHLWEIGNVSAIKQLVSQDYGITFLYEAAARKELDSGELAVLEPKDFLVEHMLSFVYLKGSLHEQEYMKWYRFFENI